MTEECKSGIRKFHWGHSGLEILSQGSFRGNYRDLTFEGSFCPPSKGLYRLILGDTVDGSTEYFSYIDFNSMREYKRTSSYHSLLENTCYPYQAAQSTYPHPYNYAELYYEEEGKEQKLITSNVSFSCPQLICRRKSRHPLCPFQSEVQKYYISFSPFVYIFLTVSK